MAASYSQSRCFWESGNQYRDGAVSLEEHLRDYTDHIFQRERHAECNTLSSSLIISEAQYDVVRGAVMAAMIQGDVQTSRDAQDKFIQMLMSCDVGTLDTLRALDNASAPDYQVMNNQSLGQIILARALSVGNRSLARDIIHSVPPASTHDLVFTPEGDQPTHADVISFGGSEFCSHRMFHGQADNGCDIWHDMIATGWASPREYLHLYAATGPNGESSRRLFDMLLQRGVRPDFRKLDMALAFGQPAIVRLYVDCFIQDNGPLSERRLHNCYTIAAQRDQVGLLEFLVDRVSGGVLDNNNVPPQTGDMPAQRDPTEPGPLQPILHEAAEGGSPAVVAWLLDRGVGTDNPRNSAGQTAYDLARAGRAFLADRLSRNPHHPARFARLQEVMDLLDARGLGPANA